MGDLNLYNVITTKVSLSSEYLSNFCLVNKDFVNIVPKVLDWLQVDFTSLQDPRLGYEQQDHIKPHCVEMTSMAMIHFGLDPENFVHFLLGKYTGQHRDICHTLDAV